MQYRFVVNYWTLSTSSTLKCVFKLKKPFIRQKRFLVNSNVADIFLNTQCMVLILDGKSERDEYVCRKIYILIKNLISDLGYMFIIYICIFHLAEYCIMKVCVLCEIF